MPRSSIQISITTRDQQYTKTINVEDTLKGWKEASDAIPKIERRIADIKRTMKEIELTHDNIMSSITQITDNIDMPRGTDISDRVGNMVVNVQTKLALLQCDLATAMADLQYEQYRVRMAENLVDKLGPKYKELLRMYYRDQMHWAQICARLFISKARMYQMLNSALKALDSSIVPPMD